MGKGGGGEENERERCRQKRRSFFYMFMPQSARKRRKLLVPSASSLEALSDCEYLSMLTLILEFKGNYFSYNMVPE